MKYELFISDFDGTLGGQPKGVPGDEFRMTMQEESAKAIKEYTDKGGKFVICTGRATDMILPICRNHNLKGLVVCFQGAQIVDIESGEEIYAGGVQLDTALEVLSRLEQEEDVVAIVAYVGDVQYYDVYNPYTEICEKRLKTKKVESIANTIKELNCSPYKLIAVCEPNKVKDFENKYNSLYGGEIAFNSGAPMVVEVINPKFDKGAAVEFLSKYYSIPFEKIIAVGDSTNDLGLINGKWHGVAVGDGHEKLKQAADEVTVDYKEYPVKVLLEKYCL